MPPGVRETIKLWTQPGTSSEALGGCNIWEEEMEEEEVGGGGEGGLLEEMTKGSSLSGGAQAIVRRHCAPR